MKPIVNYGLSDSLIDAVRKSVEEAKLHPNQQKLDVHEPEKDELTSQDFKKLRAGKKVKDGIDTKPKLKEEDEQIDEDQFDEAHTHVVLVSYFGNHTNPVVRAGKVRVTANNHDAAREEALRVMKEMGKKNVKAHISKSVDSSIEHNFKEEVEQMDEVKLADLPRRKVVGKSYGADYVDPEGADETAADMKKAEPKRKSGPQGTMKRRFIKDKSKLRMQYK